jgi:hypothetical protein
MALANNLAYYGMATITTVKKFYSTGTWCRSVLIVTKSTHSLGKLDPFIFWGKIMYNYEMV